MAAESQNPTARERLRHAAGLGGDAPWVIGVLVVSMAGLPVLRELGDRVAGPGGSERFVLLVLWAAGVLLAAGVYLLARPVLAQRRTRLARSVAVTGTVVRSHGGDHEFRRPLLAFTDVDGVRRQVASAWPGQRRIEGATVVVRYDPADPSWAVAEGRDPGLLFVALAVVVCLAMACVPLGLLALSG